MSAIRTETAGPAAAATGRGLQIEIASVEHPSLLAALIHEADEREVKVDRVTQGGGSQLLTDSEISEYLELAHSRGIEVFLFTSRRNSFDPLPVEAAGEQLHGQQAIADAVSEIHRCAALGVDGMLIADIGLLAVAGELNETGAIPKLQFKTSAAIAPLNPESARVYARLGATSINVSGATTVSDLVEMRAALSPDVTLDVYVETPDGNAGGLRYHELSALVASLQPITLKFGLSNAPHLYPYGQHLQPAAERSIRERVRRAQLALEVLARTSPVAAKPASHASHA